MPEAGPNIQLDPLSASTLTGRVRARWSLAVVLAIGAHVAMFGGALLYARLTPPHTVPPKPISATLVRLGKRADPRNLPRLAAPVHRPEAQKTAPTPTPTPPDNAVAIPSKNAPPDPAREAKEKQKRLQDALKMLGEPTDEPTSEKGEAPVGQENGDAQGTAERAAEGDRYVALVVAALRANFIVPSTITDKEKLFLATKIHLFISPDGKISRFKIDEGSGNDAYDRAVHATIEQTDHVPPPPKDLADQYWDSGLGIRFKP